MNKRKKTLDPALPNASITCWYERTLRRDIREMSREVITAIQSVFNETGMANDASPAVHFRTLLRQLTTRWGRRFNRLSQEIAKAFIHEHKVILTGPDSAAQGDGLCP